MVRVWLIPIALGGAAVRRLEKAMVDAGWKPLATEWWHFDAPDSANYPLSDEPL